MIYSDKNSNIIKKYKTGSNNLPMMFRLYKIIYGDVYVLSNFTSHNLINFIRGVEKCINTVIQITALICPQVSLESTYFKKCAHSNVFDKLSKTAKEIILTSIRG